MTYVSGRVVAVDHADLRSRTSTLPLQAWNDEDKYDSGYWYLPFAFIHRHPAILISCEWLPSQQ
jgi:hypothetical protein